MAFYPIKKFGMRMMGRHAPSMLRRLAHQSTRERGRWAMLSALMEDPECRGWLASLENPTRTKRGFEIYTLKSDVTSDWIKLHGQHEVGTERFVLEWLRPGGTFLDIGANIGYFSLLAAVAGGSNVVAFEPQRPIADLLVRSAAHNRVSERVRVECVALSDRAGRSRMTRCEGNTGHSQLVDAGTAGALPDLVPVVSLDEWMGRNGTGRISVCKIDTEGAEVAVLRGMSGLLKRDKPAIVVEVIDEFLAGFGGSRAGVLGLLAGCGYRDVTARYAAEEDSNRYFLSAEDAERRGAGQPPF